MSEDKIFFDTLEGCGLGEDERLITCGFEGSPDKVGPEHWRPKAYLAKRTLPYPRHFNVYCTISAFHRWNDGKFRRRTEAFACGCAVMFDDVGTKIHSSIVRGHTPTMGVETSPGNYQLWYCLKTPERDLEKFSAFQRAIIHDLLGGIDPGMAGPNRVGRVPGYTNGKPQHNGFRTKLVHHERDCRYTIDELSSMFGVRPRVPEPPRLVPNDIAEHRIKDFQRYLSILRKRGMLKRGGRADPSGWINIRCPFSAEHTNGADTGAAIREPRPQNQFFGGFKCWHGHCAGRGWQQLTDWIVEEFNDTQG